MSTLKSKLIRLAYENDNLRPHLIPILKESGWAGSGFTGTLSGPDFPKPGTGHRMMQQGIDLHGWDKYISLVAHAYVKAPARTKEGEDSFAALAYHTNKNFQRILSKVDVQFVDYDPYDSAEDMMQKVQQTGVLMVSKLFPQAEAFSAETNLKLRAIHDYLAHLGAAPGKRPPKQFSFVGEVKSYNKHLQLIGKQSRAVGALFTEIMGQVCHEVHFGQFPSQKVVTLPQFDWFKLGAVSGYRIVNGNLVRG